MTPEINVTTGWEDHATSTARLHKYLQARSCALPVLCLPGEVPETDQLSLPRPVDGDGDGSEVCDMGAFENRAPE